MIHKKTDSGFALMDRRPRHRRGLFAWARRKPRARAVSAVGSLIVLLTLPAFASAQVDFLFADPPPRPPRNADGTIDFGGDGYWELPFLEDLRLGMPVDSVVPFLPWSAALFEYHRVTYGKYDPELRCLPPGVAPRAMAGPYPARFIYQERPRRIVVLYEGGNRIWRTIHMDGRDFPAPEALNPTYQGYSIGHWEGDTLVVETRGYNERTWLDYAGHPHTNQLVTIERIQRPDRYTMDYEATIADPGAYSETWTTSWSIPFVEDAETFEYICQENAEFLFELTDDFGQPLLEATPAASVEP